MAHLDTGGYAPVLILGDAEWLTVRAVAAAAVPVENDDAAATSAVKTAPGRG